MTFLLCLFVMNGKHKLPDNQLFLSEQVKTDLRQSFSRTGWGQTLSVPLSSAFHQDHQRILEYCSSATSALLFNVSGGEVTSIQRNGNTPKTLLSSWKPLKALWMPFNTLERGYHILSFDLMPCIVKSWGGGLRGFFVCFYFYFGLSSLSFHVDQIFERANDGLKCNVQLVST